MRRPPDFAYDAERGIGRVTLWTFAAVGLSDAEFDARATALMRSLNAVLDAWLRRGMRGLILDFRRHRGGSFWPLAWSLAARLLPAGAPLFAWTSGQRRSRRFLLAPGPREPPAGLPPTRAGLPVGPAEAGAPLAPPRLPVALLIGPATSSSGEIGAAMFAKRPDVRAFGARTDGALSVNAEWPVAPGVRLVLTQQHVQLADGATADWLEPDVPTAAPLRAAQAWLKSRGSHPKTASACRRINSPGRGYEVATDQR